MTTDSDRRARLREFRMITSRAVAELRSDELRSSYHAITLEELTDEAITELDNPTDDPRRRVGRLQRITKIRDELRDNIEAMKETPPELFRSADPEEDVNTPPETDE
jgi:hypothetical protein